MKLTTAAIFAATLCVSAFAGTLTDTANIFGPRAAEVNATLAQYPVWIETQVQTPGEGIKNYTDTRVIQLTQRGFLLVVTTQPRAWRISMNPIGIASSEGVRSLGDKMAARFRNGNFADGAMALAHDLTELAAVRQQAVVYERQYPAPKEKDNTEMWIWITVFGLAGVAIIVAIALLMRRSRQKFERDMRKKFPRSDDPKPSPEKAQMVYDQYTPAERERLRIQYIDHPSYHRGVMDDPLTFYLFMNAIQQPHYVSSPSYINDDPPVRHHSSPSRSYSDDSSPSSSPSPSFDSSPSSSSDFGGGGGSIDSGGSSSDSSGGGGSW